MCRPQGRLYSLFKPAMQGIGLSLAGLVGLLDNGRSGFVPYRNSVWINFISLAGQAYTDMALASRSSVVVKSLKFRWGPGPSVSASLVDQVGEATFPVPACRRGGSGARADSLRSTFSRSGRSTVTFQ